MLFDAGTTSGEAWPCIGAWKRPGRTTPHNATRFGCAGGVLLQPRVQPGQVDSQFGAASRALEAFRDVRLRYQTGLSSEVDLSITQKRLIASLVQRLNATVGVNITYTQLLQLLLVPRDPRPAHPGTHLEGSHSYSQ